jgi:hypothetical protein
MSDRYVREIGHVQGLDGLTIRVGVDYDHVTISAGARVHLNDAQAETFAQLFVRAVWVAGRHRQLLLMDEDVHEAALD